MYLLEPDLFNTINFVSSGVSCIEQVKHTISRQLISLPNCFFHLMLKTDIVLSGFYYFVLLRGVIGEEVCFRPVLLSCGVMGEEVCFRPVLLSHGVMVEEGCFRPVLLSRGVMGDVFCFRPVLFRGVMEETFCFQPVLFHGIVGEAFCFRPVLLSRGVMGRHFVFGLSSCPKCLYPQLILQIQIQIFLFPIKEPFRAEQLTKNLIQ